MIAHSPSERHASSPAELKARLEAERAGAAFLVHRDAAGRQRIVVLPRDRSRLTVGRGGGAGLRLADDDQVSRTHAEIEHMGTDWAVVDDGLSTNGTFVNGERLRGRRRLSDGDQLRFGRTVVVFRAPAAGESDTTAMAGDAPGVVLTEAQRRVLTALCRPLRDSAFATPATNQEIAAEVCLGVDAVKVHLRALYRKLGIEGLPQNAKRARLVELALRHGLIAEGDLFDRPE